MNGPSDEPKPPLRKVLLRWALALGIGLGGAYVARRIIVRVQMRAQTRVLLLDFARFQGCLFGVPTPRDADAPDRAVALAEGTGDPIWPHTCAMALTRMEHTADEVAADDTHERPLADAVRAMESALGEAVFWTEHVQEGRVEPPQWVGAFFSLRHAVGDFASRHGTTLPPAEAPHHPRVPRAPSASAAPVRAVALPGGEEADLLGAIATPLEFAVALRDRSSHYTLCRWPIAHDAPIRCQPFHIPNIADPRYAGFAPSERGAHLAVWARAPYSLRGLVDIGTNSIPLIASGDPDATRDFWVGPTNDFAIQINHNGPAVLVGEGSAHREVELPASLNVLTESRALLGTPRGALEVWLDAAVATRTEMRAIALGLAADPPGATTTVATFRAPRLTGTDRRIVPCSVPGGPAYVLAGDSHGASLFVTDDGVHLARGPELAMALDATVQIACDAESVSAVRREAEGLNWTRCTRDTCQSHAPIQSGGEVAITATGGALLVGDGVGDARALRLRRFEADGSEREATFTAERPSARAVLLASRGEVVALFAADAESMAYRSEDGGRTFNPAVVAR